MGFLDRLLGREPVQQHRQPSAPTGQPYSVPAPSGGASTEDERAIARYKYLLRTAPPETIERTHAEAFEQLTPEQRQMVLQRMSTELPPGEAPTTTEPQELARAATRAEMRNPGYLQRSFGGGMMPGFGGSMLGAIAGVVVGSMVADALFNDYGSSPEAQEVGDTGSGDTGSGDTGSGDTGSGDTGSGDTGSGDAGSGDAGSGDAGSGDSAGDLGASDFGDFGGGDFGGDFGGFGDF